MFLQHEYKIIRHTKNMLTPDPEKSMNDSVGTKHVIAARQGGNSVAYLLLLTGWCIKQGK